MSPLNMFIELLETLPVVFSLYVCTVVFSVPLGILGALAYTGKNKIVKSILSVYTWVFRGTPLMLQLFIVYYGIPLINFFGYRVKLDPYSAAVLTFVINYAAYLIEIMRSGLESIDQGQHEAAKVLGYSYWQKTLYIILPQAIRRVLPTLGSEAITLIKDTSLIYVLAVTEIMKRTKELANQYYNITPYICAIIIYLVLSLAVDRLFKNAEKKNKIRIYVKDMKEKIIEVINLKKQFGNNLILDDINFTINKGEAVSLIGPSGSGKSTILRCIADLETLTSGKILIEGHDLQDKGIDKKIKKELLLKTGMIFQNFNLFPHMTVKDNIVKTLRIVKKTDVKKAEEIAEKVLETVGLADKKDNFPNELSGGQKQRVAIARGLALEPDILLFDEPTSALDPELVKEVLDIIRKLKKERKMTMLIVSHEMKFVREISDEVIVMENGKILEKGTVEKIFENPETQRVKEFLNTIY